MSAHAQHYMPTCEAMLGADSCSAVSVGACASCKCFCACLFIEHADVCLHHEAQATCCMDALFSSLVQKCRCMCVCMITLETCRLMSADADVLQHTVIAQSTSWQLLRTQHFYIHSSFCSHHVCHIQSAREFHKLNMIRMQHAGHDSLYISRRSMPD